MTDGKPVVLVLRYIRYLSLAAVSPFPFDEVKRESGRKDSPGILSFMCSNNG
jgi:hypothetical protein